MWIKRPESTPWNRRKHFRLMVLVLIGGYTSFVFLVGASARNNDWARRAVSMVTDFPSHPLRQLQSNLMTDPERIIIDIKQIHYDKLAAKREEALRRRILISSTDDFVPAKIRYGSEQWDVKVRLKGDMADHWMTDKWSLRVVVKGDKTLFGMKEFSLQHPSTRSYIDEWLYHSVLRLEDLPALRYMFIDVTLNGHALGIYALEEHFEKRMIENNRLREGPVVRFNEDLNWEELVTQSYGVIGFEKDVSGAGSYLASEVDSFGTGKWRNDPEKLAIHDQAVQLLDGYRRGDVSTSQAFDIVKLAKFMAVSDLLGAGHAINWRNARFYYKPNYFPLGTRWV